MKTSRRYRSGLTLLLIISIICTASFARRGWACGLDWLLPSNHFDGVNEGGNVSYWEQVSSIHLTDGLELPVFINFNSARDTSSPYLGKGWIMPLFDSHFEQLDENSFRMLQPDGLAYDFHRRGPNDNVLDGGNAWRAEINGDTITATASCGWKLTFKQGHIISASTPKGERLDWIYENGKVIGLRENGQDRVSMKQNVASSTSYALYSSGEKVAEFQQEKSPWVRSVSGVNVIGEFLPSLRRVINSHREIHNYDLMSDSEKNGLPMLKISNESGSGFLSDGGRRANWSFEWNAVDRTILSDGLWTYKIQRCGDPRVNALIERTNVAGGSEFWDYDGDKGQETTRSIDGITTVKTWFMFGPQLGKTRKITQESHGKTSIKYQAFYDELGRVIKQTDEGNVSQVRYQGRDITAIDRLGKGFATIKHIQDGPNNKYFIQKNGKEFYAIVDPQQNILDFREIVKN